MKKFIKFIIIISILVSLWFIFLKPIYCKVFKIRDIGQSTEIMTIKKASIVGENIKPTYENRFDPQKTIPTGFEAVLIGKYGDEFRVPITSDTYSTFLLNTGKQIEVLVETSKDNEYSSKVVSLNEIIDKEDSLMDIVDEFQN